MGAPAGFDVEGIRAENEQLKAENAQLHSTVNELNNKVRSWCLLNFFKKLQVLILINFF